MTLPGPPPGASVAAAYGASIPEFVVISTRVAPANGIPTIASSTKRCSGIRERGRGAPRRRDAPLPPGNEPFGMPQASVRLPIDAWTTLPMLPMLVKATWSGRNAPRRPLARAESPTKTHNFGPDSPPARAPTDPPSRLFSRLFFYYAKSKPREIQPAGVSSLAGRSATVSTAACGPSRLPTARPRATS